MPILLMQLTLSVLGGILLFHLWRRFVAPHPFGWIVTTGFVIRAFAAQLLFWISYLELPFGQSMQEGQGLWFFGSDATVYLPAAFRAAEGGVEAIVVLTRGLPSVTYIQVLSLFSLWMGSVASVAILLNLFAFLGSCAIVLRGNFVSRETVFLALVALSLSPAAILWSLQPLKDTLFQFLVMLFVAAAALWQWAWDRAARLQAVYAGILMIVTLYGVAGIRWYYALACLSALALFLSLVTLRAAGNRLLVMASSGVLFVGLIAAFLYGGGPYVPDFVRKVFVPASAGEAISGMGGELVAKIEDNRSGFVKTKGSTAIGSPTQQAWSLTVESTDSSRSGAEGTDVARPATPGAPASARSGAAPLSTSPGENLTGTRLRGLVAGIAAMFLPRFIGQSLGLLKIDGGRGLMWFAELDTIFFDLALLAALVLFLRKTKRLLMRSPVFWLVVVMTVLVTFPLAYTVANFGTLFRLRAMVFVAMALLPLALTNSPASADRVRGPGRDAAPPASWMEDPRLG